MLVSMYLGRIAETVSYLNKLYMVLFLVYIVFVSLSRSVINGLM